MQIVIDPSSIESYRTFLAVKQLPTYRIRGRVAEFPDEYADRLKLKARKKRTAKLELAAHLFDYQRDISKLAIEKERFAIFGDCGLGKTLMFFEFAKHAAKCIDKGQAVLIISPLMVVEQTLAEALKWYPDLKIEMVNSGDCGAWLQSGGRIGITNYEALKNDFPAGRLGALIIDESSMLKGHYGRYGQAIIELGKGLTWKLALTGTPAPNDRIEYGNHAVFLDQFPNVNAFLAKYFVNRGQTQERWVLKPHALEPFYRSLSHWCIFLSNPAVYGWKDNCTNLPPIHVHIQDVDLTSEQESLVQKQTGDLFAHNLGGIVGRSALGRIAKGSHKGKEVETLKPQFIRSLVDSWPDESTIIWCIYNDEQDRMAATFPDAANISGDTPHEKRMELLADFKAGRRKVLISKPAILGYGLNLQIATRMVFSGLQDSYEKFYQAVKRANRIGSTRPLNVHIPVTDIERPMIETVLQKATRVQEDTETQERIFKQARDRNAL